MPATRFRAGDVGRQVVDEDAFGRSATGQPAAVIEEAGFGLAYADFVRQDQVVEVDEGIGELESRSPEITARAKLVRQQNPPSN